MVLTTKTYSGTLTDESDGATVDVAMTVDVPAPPEPEPEPLAILGSFGWRTDGTVYTAPSGAEPLGTHAYGGPKNNQAYWGQPVTELTCAANMRPLEKPSTRITSSVVDKVLRGDLDAMWSSMAATVSALPHRIIGTVWHEPLAAVEFVVGEPTQRWSDVFLYVIAFMEAEGVTNVDWYSCLMASQYHPNTNSPQGGDTFHTADLLERLDGVGADMYLTASSWHPDTDVEWQAFADYHPDMRHALLEFALWSDPTHQAECFDEVDAWFRTYDTWTALVGFFKLGDPSANPPKKDGRLSPEGAEVFDRMAMDADFYGRTA